MLKIFWSEPSAQDQRRYSRRLGWSNAGGQCAAGSLQRALNKCFVVMSDTVTDHTIGSFDKQRTLWDINDRVTLGSILTSFGPEPGTPIDGPKKDRVRECCIEYPEYDPRHFGHCESDDQWRELIKFYMERP